MSGFPFLTFFQGCGFKAAISPMWCEHAFSPVLWPGLVQAGCECLAHITKLAFGDENRPENPVEPKQACGLLPLSHNVQVHCTCLKWKHFNISSFESMYHDPLISWIFEAVRNGFSQTFVRDLAFLFCFHFPSRKPKGRCQCLLLF